MRNLYFLLPPLLLLFLLTPTAGSGEPAFTNSLGMKFVKIEPGTFMMGSPADEPDRNTSEKRHQATISEPFYMQTTEVTLGQWWAVMGKKWLFPRKGPENMPVTGVSWHDCRRFAEKLSRLEKGSYRLPTEAEWEYACRAGTQTIYSWGDTIDCSRAMFANSRLKADRCIPVYQSMGLETGAPAPVKSFSPNPWGLYDMHGNVWEWCLDCFSEYPGDGSSGVLDCDRRVRRGGSWISSAHNLRSANRAYAHPAAKFRTTGFRVVKKAP